MFWNALMARLQKSRNLDFQQKIFKLWSLEISFEIILYHQSWNYKSNIAIPGAILEIMLTALYMSIPNPSNSSRLVRVTRNGYSRSKKWNEHFMKNILWEHYLTQEPDRQYFFVFTNCTALMHVAAHLPDWGTANFKI